MERDSIKGPLIKLTLQSIRSDLLKATKLLGFNKFIVQLSLPLCPYCPVLVSRFSKPDSENRQTKNS
jgi:hypothetical protein